MGLSGVTFTTFQPVATLGELEKQRIRAARSATVDTIAPAQDAVRSFSPSKPRLDPAIRAVNICDKFYSSGLRMLDLNCEKLDQEKKEIEEMCHDNISKLEDAAKRSQEAGVWDYLQKIGSGVLSAISIFLGVSLVTSGATTFIGAALIGAGIVSLANVALTEAGLWDWAAEKLASDEENKKRIRNYAPLIVGLLANGVQFLGLGAFSIWGTLALAPQVLLIAQTITNVATTVTSVGGQITEARVAWSQAALTELQGKISISQYEVEHLTKDIEDVLAKQSQAHRSARNLMDLTIETRRQALYVI